MGTDEISRRINTLVRFCARRDVPALTPGLADVAAMTRAALFDRYLRQQYGLAADLIEQESTNCGNNVTNALELLRANDVPHGRLVLVQDATMQQRMDAGFRRQAAPSTRIVNYAAHQTLVDSSLAYEHPPAGMWPLDRYVSMLIGEVPRLTGYGPAGRKRKSTSGRRGIRAAAHRPRQ